MNLLLVVGGVSNFWFDLSSVEVFNLDKERVCRSIAGVPRAGRNSYLGLASNGAPLVCGGFIANLVFKNCFTYTVKTIRCKSLVYVASNLVRAVNRSFAVNAMVSVGKRKPVL